MKLATGALLILSQCFAASDEGKPVIVRPVIVVRSSVLIVPPYYGYRYLHAPIIAEPFVPTFSGPTTTAATDPPALRRKRHPVTAEPKADQ